MLRSRFGAGAAIAVLGTDGLLEALRGPGTPGRVDTVVETWDEARGGLAGFVER